MTNNNIKIEKINIKEALRYLGYGDSVPGKDIEELLLLCEEELLKVARPMYTYRVFELCDDFSVTGCNFVLKGNDIKKHLSGCDKAVFMCVTLSVDVDRLIRLKQVGNMAQAMMIDSLANAMIEQVCDEVENIIKKELPEYNLTWRYGLGYGDFPLEGQKDFLNVLDAQKKVGVCVSDSLLLTPTKSVTCVIGLSKAENTHKGLVKCEYCNMKDSCNIRRRGDNCGN